MQAKKEWLDIVQQSLLDQNFVKLTLSKPRAKTGELKNVYGRMTLLRGFPHLTFTLRHQTQDITKNFLIPESLQQLEKWLEEDFLNADLFTTQNDWQLQTNKKGNGRCIKKPALIKVVPNLKHDHQKKHLLSTESQPYLQALGISGTDGKVLKTGQRKFRQINKYIEMISHLLKDHPLPAEAHIVDMGSGKGYLTFALYDYLKNKQEQNIRLTGIELRENLVDLCNDIAQKSKFEALHFECKDIHQYHPDGGIDMLIALHACDTATDEAIAKGIAANADIIIVAPCCHKQVRKAMKPPEELKPLLRHGILLERQAELLTDSLRALYLEAAGYSTKVFEFVSTEHTPKNVMITATKSKINPVANEQIAALKQQFGLSYHHLDKLLV